MSCRSDLDRSSATSTISPEPSTKIGIRCDEHHRVISHLNSCSATHLGFIRTWMRSRYWALSHSRVETSLASVAQTCSGDTTAHLRYLSSRITCSRLHSVDRAPTRIRSGCVPRTIGGKQQTCWHSRGRTGAPTGWRVRSNASNDLSKRARSLTCDSGATSVTGGPESRRHFGPVPTCRGGRALEVERAEVATVP